MGKSSMTGVLSKPIFTISLDMELGWGFILHQNHKTLALLREDPKQGRGNVEVLLDLFEKYDISATWAVVGHLFLDVDKGSTLISKELPQFRENQLDWEYYNSHIVNNPLYYGRDVVERILASRVKQEIGLHGLFHLLFDQCSQKVADAEVREGLKLAGLLGLNPQTFVFPSNAISHLETLRKYGFGSYRGKFIPRWNIPKTIAPPGDPKCNDGIWEIPTSLCFVDPVTPFALLPRAKLGLNRAIRRNKVFHIFLHPHDLLRWPSLIKTLDQFLGVVAKKRDQGKLQLMTMGELTTYLKEDHE